MSESKLSPEVVEKVCGAIDAASDELRRLNLEVIEQSVLRTA